MTRNYGGGEKPAIPGFFAYSKQQPAAATRRLASLHIGPFRFDDLPAFSDPAVADACDRVLTIQRLGVTQTLKLPMPLIK